MRQDIEALLITASAQRLEIFDDPIDSLGWQLEQEQLPTLVQPAQVTEVAR